MTTIDEVRLEFDLGYGFGYLAEFSGFGQDGPAVYSCKFLRMVVGSLPRSDGIRAPAVGVL